MRFFPWNNTDPVASAIIAAVRSAGGTVSSAQEMAINSFVVAEKAASRWTLVKRLHVPIWGVAAANAIDWVARGSGTFNGTVTHASGYVQSNGSTGYFDFGASLGSCGLSASNGLLFALCSLADSRSDPRTHIGVTNGVGFEAIDSISGSQIRMYYGNGTSGQGQIPSTLSPRSAQVGILSACFDGSTRNFRRRVTAGAASISSTSGIAYNISGGNLFAMALNATGTPARFHDGRFGAYGCGLAMSNANADAFSANLKTLWESCTGLTLP